MHVAVHALARRDAARELVLDGMAALVLANRGVAGEGQALVTILGIPAGVYGRTVVRVDDVAGGTAGGAVVAGMVVAAHEVEQRVVEARLLQVEIDWVNAVQRPEAAFAEAAGGLAGRLDGVRDAELVLPLAALLEDAENVARLADGEARERVEVRQDAVTLRVLGRDGRGVREAQRGAVGGVGLAVERRLLRNRTVVVERRAPEHRAVPHHRVTDAGDFLLVAGAAGLVRDAQVAGIYELDELRGFLVEEDGGIVRVCRAGPPLAVTRRDVGLAHEQAGRGVAAVTIRAAEHDVRRLVHRMLVGPEVAFEAAARFERGGFAGLVDDVWGGKFAGRVARQINRDGDGGAKGG